MMENDQFLNTYNYLPVNITGGKGAWLIDKKGDKYLDLFAGLAVNALGYSHPSIIKAVIKQVSEYSHVSNYFLTDVQTTFAGKLLKYSRMDKLFLTNSGTEAAEAALKLIRKKYGPEKTILSISGGFHGRTYGALSITARPKYKNGFEPLLRNIDTIELNDIEDLRKKTGSNTAAVFIELIQGEGGINESNHLFIEELISLRDKYGFLIVADEIQSGVGRTGKAFAYDHYQFLPDIVLSAKAIGGGLPLGAVLVNKKLENVFTPGSHGTTFGGNPVSCAAGIIVLEEVFEKGLIMKVADSGRYLKEQLITIQQRNTGRISEVRGKGFMLGVEMKIPCKIIVQEMLKRKIIINFTNDNVIRLLPPFIITREEIDHFLSEFEGVIKKTD
jgi:acetylornithine/N-succinyldiaminopimelate aminotransferase